MAEEEEQEEAAGVVVDGRVCQMENSEEKEGGQGETATGGIKALDKDLASHPSVLNDGLKGTRVRRGEERSGPSLGRPWAVPGPSLGRPRPFVTRPELSAIVPPQPSLHFNWSHHG